MTVLVCSFIVRPSLGLWSPVCCRVPTYKTAFYTGDVTRSHPASISPSVSAIAIFILAIYLGQVGYCTLLIFARKPETKVCCCLQYCLLRLTNAREHRCQRCRSRSRICKLGYGRLGYCMGTYMGIMFKCIVIESMLGIRGIFDIDHPPWHPNPIVIILQCGAHCVSRPHLASSS